MSFQASMLLLVSAVTATTVLLVAAGWRHRGLLLFRGTSQAVAPRTACERTQQYLRFENGLMDVDTELRNTVARLRPLAVSNLVRIDVATQPGLAVQADSAAVRQVLTDMVSTAIENAAGGSVLLTALRLGPKVNISASDDGQAPDHGRREAALRPACELIALRGGRLDIDARDRQGATVTLQLPAAAAASTEPPLLQESEAPLRRHGALHTC